VSVPGKNRRFTKAFPWELLPYASEKESAAVLA